MHCPICGSLADTLMPARSAEPITRPPLPDPSASLQDISPTRPMSPAAAGRAAERPLIEVRGYEVLGVLGRGGAGVVYKARHLVLDRLVALKVLATGAHAGPEELARFQSEAEAAARLQHPNIVQLYEVGETNGRPYLAMEYLAGGSLAAKLARQPQPPRLAAEMVRTLARAIHFAHQNHILHRDLKPGNVLLAADDTPKVSDFGLAKRLDLDAAARAQLTPTGAIIGTPSYMAPEQAGGSARHFGPGVDVYALGAILYEMLTGRPPFLGETLTDTLFLVLDVEPIPPRRLNPTVSRDLETICLRCLQKRPASRYVSAASLADDLERFLEGRPILARPVGRIERAIKWARRRPAQAALLAVSTLALLLGGVGIAWHQMQLQSKNDALVKALDAEEQQRRRNVQLLRVALQTQSDYGNYLDEQLKPLPHLTRLRFELLEKRQAFFQPILEREPDDAEMRQTQGVAFLAVGIIQQRLGHLDEAEKKFRAALERLDLLGEQTSPASRRPLAEVHVQYGMLLSALDRDDEAGRHLETAERLLNQLVADAPDEDNRRVLALACHNRALFLVKKKHIEPARQLYERAIQLRQRLIEEHPHEDRYQRELAGSYVNLAALDLRNGQPEQARAAMRQAEEILRQQPLDVENRHLLAGHHLNLGIVEQQRAPRQAMTDFQEALRIWSDLLAQFPDVANFRRRAASAHFLLALRYEAAKQLPEARRHMAESLEMSRQLLRQAPESSLYEREVGAALYHLGRLSHALRRDAEAEALWNEYRLLIETALRHHPERADLRQGLVMTLAQLGELYRQRGIALRMSPPVPLLPVAAHLAVALHDLGNLSLGDAYLARAAACHRQGLREQRQILASESARPIHYWSLSEHARALAALAEAAGDYDDLADAAEAEARAAHGLASEADGGQRFRQAAGYVARCARLAGAARHLPPAEQTARAARHADAAVELLTKAVRAGFRNATNLETAPDLAPIRSRPDFRNLLAEVKRSKR